MLKKIPVFLIRIILLSIIILISTFLLLKEQSAGLIISMSSFMPTELLIKSGNNQLCEIALKNIEKSNVAKRKKLVPFFKKSLTWNEHDWNASRDQTWWMEYLIVNTDTDISSNPGLTSFQCFQNAILLMPPVGFEELYAGPFTEKLLRNEAVFENSHLQAAYIRTAPLEVAKTAGNLLRQNLDTRQRHSLIYLLSRTNAYGVLWALETLKAEGESSDLTMFFKLRNLRWITHEEDKELIDSKFEVLTDAEKMYVLRKSLLVSQDKGNLKYFASKLRPLSLHSDPVISDEARGLLNIPALAEIK